MIITGRFGGGYALVHFRGSYLEVDLGDMRSDNSLFGLIGRDGALRMHVPITKFPIHYMVDSQTLTSIFRNAKCDFKSKSKDAGEYGRDD